MEQSQIILDIAWQWHETDDQNTRKRLFTELQEKTGVQSESELCGVVLLLLWDEHQKVHKEQMRAQRWFGMWRDEIKPPAETKERLVSRADDGEANEDYSSPRKDFEHLEHREAVAEIARRWKTGLRRSDHIDLWDKNPNHTEHQRLELLMELRDKLGAVKNDEFILKMLLLFHLEYRWTFRLEKALFEYREMWENVGEEGRSGERRLIKRLLEDSATSSLSHEDIARIVMVHPEIVQRTIDAPWDSAFQPISIDDLWDEDI